MADREFYVGSSGPFLYDDTDTYDDGELRRAFRCDQMLLNEAPGANEESVRLQDLGDALLSSGSVQAYFFSLMLG